MSIPEKAIVADCLYCPLNIDNSHWVLVVYCKSSKLAYNMDPYHKKASYYDRMMELSCKLVENFNEFFALNVQLGVCPFKRSQFLLQDNSYDCGPFVCAYAIGIAIIKNPFGVKKLK